MVLNDFETEVQNSWATKSSYAKWRYTPSYQLEKFYRNSYFELLTQIRETLNFTSCYQRSNVKLLLFHYRVANSMLKNLKFLFELLTQSWK